MIPEHMKREIERAIHDAEHPVGMGPHTGMARISAATLRRLMAENAALEAVARQALGLICSARLCEVNSMSSRQEMLRLLIEAADALRAALKEQA